MTTEAISLIHRLSTLAAVRNHLAEVGDDVGDDTIQHIIDFHFQRRSTWLRHLETKGWLWLHGSFKQTAEGWIAELPLDIVDHRVSRVDLEEKALRICILQRFVEIAGQRHQQTV